MGVPIREVYPRSEPIDERAMDKHRYDGHHTICQNLRDMYHMVDSLRGKPSDEMIDEIRVRCRIGMTMAKKMQNKLKWYREWYIRVLAEDPKPMEKKFDNEKIGVD